MPEITLPAPLLEVWIAVVVWAADIAGTAGIDPMAAITARRHTGVCTHSTSLTCQRDMNFLHSGTMDIELLYHPGRAARDYSG